MTRVVDNAVFRNVANIFAIKSRPIQNAQRVNVTHGGPVDVINIKVYERLFTLPERLEHCEIPPLILDSTNINKPKFLKDLNQYWVLLVWH